MNENTVRIFVGNVIHCPEKLKVELLENGFVAVQGKQIIAVGGPSSFERQLKHLESKYNVDKVVHLTKSQLLIPGFVDAHIHAPQYPNSGLGYDKTLLDWLDAYTYKLERKYADLKWGKKVFDAVVKRSLNSGTTTACYFASLFNEASLMLVDTVIELGQRALIGKVNMTKSPYHDYVETKGECLENTEKFIECVASKKNDLVQPIITPRYALSLDLDDMTKLAVLAKNGNLHIQTHMAENTDEVRLVKETYGMPYANVYDTAKLLTNKTVIAQGIYLDDDELQLLKERGSSIAHCPESNTCLKSGLCDVRRLLSHGITVGLGSDVSGGPSPSIVRAMRAALDTSVHLFFNQENYEPLNYTDVFYLATLGGAEALTMEDRIGNFKEGKEFDALLIDIDPENEEIGNFLECTPMEVLQKFIYCGDDRNILRVFVAGKNVKC